MTEPAVLQMLTMSALLGALWSVICRVHALHPTETRPEVAVGHWALGFGIFCALLLPPPWGKFAMAMGVLVFLLSGSHRWQRGAPQGTRKGVDP